LLVKQDSFLSSSFYQYLLNSEGGRYALITACADGGLGHAAIIERYD
jgi:hypothetical protein